MKGDPPDGPAFSATGNGSSTPPPTLKRSLSLPLIVLYGLGTTIGAGIYALIGEVAADAGLFAPVSFLAASLLAGFSAFSFAELSARFPSSAGEARYIREGLNSGALALVTGLLVILAGSVSAAAVSHGFAGYFQELADIPRPLAVTLLILTLGLIAAWGIGQSVRLAGLLTLVEAGGLILVIWAGSGMLPDSPLRASDLLPPFETGVWSGILAGSFIAFFAFIGFEDMVNVAEEVKDVRRNLPTAIIITLAVTLVLYVALAAVAVLAVPVADLAASDAPLALLYARATGGPGTVISVIAVVATVNGALIQIIMASRVLYGLASQGLLPAPLARIHRRTRTPLLATALVTAFVLGLAIPFKMAALAEATSVVTLVIFTLVNLALWRVKRRDPRPMGVPLYPLWIPVTGFFVSAGFVTAAAISVIAP